MPECYRTLSAEMNNPGVGTLVAGEFTFAEMNGEVGCSSKDNEVKNRVVFDRKYYGREVTWQGQVDSISTKGIRVVFNRVKTNYVDFEIEFLKHQNITEQNGFQLDTGDLVTLKFTITNLGNCTAPYYGDRGVIVAGRQ
jgi:hypothetical protein